MSVSHPHYENSRRHISGQTVLVVTATLGACIFWGLAFWFGYS